MTITEFLEARIAKDEEQANYLLRGLEADIAENFAGMMDEWGPMTPSRKIHAEMWGMYDGQSKTRNFAKGQVIADLVDPARVLAECAAKRAIIKATPYVGDDVIEWLAAIYKDHPDYQQEWAP